MPWHKLRINAQDISRGWKPQRDLHQGTIRTNIQGFIWTVQC